MMRGKRAPVRAALAALALVLSGALAAWAAPDFRTLEPGIEWGDFPGPPSTPADGDVTIHVVRVDPKRFHLRLFSAGTVTDGDARTIAQWSRDYDLVAAVNAAMYQEDGVRSVSLMRRKGYVNNPRLSRDNSVLLFDPLDPALPPVVMADRTCGEYEGRAASYEGAIQSIRMLSCKGENTWAPQPQRWPASLVGIDGEGRVLFIYCGGLLTMHDFVETLRKLELGLTHLQYGEGGDRAQLCVDAGGFRRDFGGGFAGRPVPNVLGFERIPTR